MGATAPMMRTFATARTTRLPLNRIIPRINPNPEYINNLSFL